MESSGLGERREGGVDAAGVSRVTGVTGVTGEV